MSGTEQVFFLIVVPVAIVALIWALASIRGPKAQKRYRPGRPYAFTPVWYVANHRRGPRTDRAVGAAPPGRELTSGGREPTESRSAQGTTGGASDRW